MTRSGAAKSPLARGPRPAGEGTGVPQHSTYRNSCSDTMDRDEDDATDSAQDEPPQAQTSGNPQARTAGKRGRHPPLVPEGRQLAVMSILWRLGSATVNEVQQELNELQEPEIAYNTVLTYLRTLRSRRWVQIMPVGKAHRFLPAVSIDYVRWLEIERITDLLFDGSREELLVALFTDRHTSPRTLERARLALEQRLAAPAPERAYRTTGSTMCDGRSAER